MIHPNGVRSAVLSALILAAGMVACVQESPSGRAPGAVGGHRSPLVIGMAQELTPQLTAMDESPPLRDIAPAIVNRREENDRRHRHVNRPDRPTDPKAQTTPGTGTAMSALHDFEGLGDGFTGPTGQFNGMGLDPPDTNGAVGPNHYVQTVNVYMAVFSKDGTPLYGPVALKTLFKGLGGDCELHDDGDPVVKYDALADRWLVTQFALPDTNKPSYECIAVSKTSDPTGAYYRYAFQFNDFKNFPVNDYPKWGVWRDGYYLTANMFPYDDSTSTDCDAGTGPSPDGGSGDVVTAVCAFDRDAMLAGKTPKAQCFPAPNEYSLLPADLSGKSDSPAANAPEFVMGLTSDDKLGLWKLHVDWTTPGNSTLMGPTTFDVAPFSYPDSVTQPKTSVKLDAISEGLMTALAYRKFPDHEALVANHTVGSGTHVGVRWYELRDPAGTPVLHQSGTYVPDADERWMGSANVDRAGNIAIGYSASGTTLLPSIRYTGRTSSDPLGQLAQSEHTMTTGKGVHGTMFSDPCVPIARWGDYSSMGVDPADDCTFWFTSEYLTTTDGDFHTRVGSFKFAGCEAAILPDVGGAGPDVAGPDVASAKDGPNPKDAKGADRPADAAPVVQPGGKDSSAAEPDAMEVAGGTKGHGGCSCTVGQPGAAVADGGTWGAIAAVSLALAVAIRRRRRRVRAIM